MFNRSAMLHPRVRRHVKLRPTLLRTVLCSVSALLFSLSATATAATGPVTSKEVTIKDSKMLQQQVSQQVSRLMQQQQIPGMAVAVLWQGKPYLYSFGLADQQAGTPVSADTLFEIGSVTKTFNGLLSAVALSRGEFSLDDPVSKHWPALNGKQWQPITMRHLATYTTGGLPLFLPEAVQDKPALLQYLQQWQPTQPAGTFRLYANASIGLFGHLAAQTSGLSYAEALQQRVLQPLGLQHTYLQVPAVAMAQYAYGYEADKFGRNTPGLLSAEAGGMKASVRDLASYVQAYLQSSQQADPHLRAAFSLTQQRYASSGAMYQGLGWEMLDMPVQLKDLQAVTAPEFVAGTPAQLLQPAGQAKPDAWVHKTGATAGFAAYVAFIPSQQVGIVLLANKRYPNALRVELAQQILTALAAK